MQSTYGVNAHLLRLEVCVELLSNQPYIASCLSTRAVQHVEQSALACLGAVADPMHIRQRFLVARCLTLQLEQCKLTSVTY